jgi:hypothetical protein
MNRHFVITVGIQIIVLVQDFGKGVKERLGFLEHELDELPWNQGESARKVLP